MGLDPALGTPNPLTGEAPQQTLAFEAVGGRRGGPDDEVVRSGVRDRVDDRLNSLLVDV